MGKIKRIKTMAIPVLFVILAFSLALSLITIKRTVTVADADSLVAGTDFSLSGSDGDLNASLTGDYGIVGQAGSGSGFVSAGGFSRHKGTIIKFTESFSANTVKTLYFAVTKNISAIAVFDFYRNDAETTLGNSEDVVFSFTNNRGTNELYYVCIDTADFADDSGNVSSFIIVHESDARADGDYDGFSSRIYSMTVNPESVTFTANLDFCYTSAGISADKADGYTAIGQAGTSTNATLGAFVSTSMNRQKYSLIKFTTPLNANIFDEISFYLGKNMNPAVTYDFYKNDSGITVGNVSDSAKTVVFTSTTNGGAADTAATVNTIKLRLRPFADEKGYVYGIIMAHTTDARAEGDYAAFSQRMYNITANVRSETKELTIGTDFIITNSNKAGLTLPAATGPVTESGTGLTKYFVNEIAEETSGTVVKFNDSVNIDSYNTAVIEYKFGISAGQRVLKFYKNVAGTDLSDAPESYFTTEKKKPEGNSYMKVDLRSLADKNGDVDSFIISMLKVKNINETINFYSITLINENYEEKTLGGNADFYLRGNIYDLKDDLVGCYDANEGLPSGVTYISSAVMTRGKGTAIMFANSVNLSDYKSVAFDMSKNTSDTVVFAVYPLTTESLSPENAAFRFSVGKSANVASSVVISLSGLAENGVSDGFILVHESDNRVGDEYASFTIRVYPIDLKKDDVVTPSIKMGIDLKESITARFTLQADDYSDVVFKVNDTTVSAALDGKYYYTEIGPHRLCEDLNIDATFKNAADASVVYMFDKSISVVDYCVGLLAKSAEQLGYTEAQTAKLKQLVVDLIYYGQAAQTYTDTNADVDIVSRIVGDYSARTYVTPASVRDLENNDGDYKWKSATLNYGNTIRLVLTLSTVGDAPDYIKLNVGGNTVNISENEYKGEEDGRRLYKYYYDVSLVNFDSTITAKIVVGEEEQAATLTYSVASYVVNQIAKDGVSDAEKDFLKRVYCYGKSAYDFAGSL